MMAADALYRESQYTVTESCVLLELGSNGFLRRFVSLQNDTVWWGLMEHNSRVV
jgi:hypothetical protein